MLGEDPPFRQNEGSDEWRFDSEKAELYLPLETDQPSQRASSHTSQKLDQGLFHDRHWIFVVERHQNGGHRKDRVAWGLVDASAGGV